MSNEIHSYQDLVVWQKATDLAIAVYNLTKTFPREETYGLTAQVRRSAVSISSNIAEGRRRGSKKDFRQFCIVAYGSGAELETQIIISKKLGYGKKEDYIKVDELLDEVMRMLNKLIGSLGESPKKPRS